MALNIHEIPPEGLTLELAEKLDLFTTGAATTAFAAALTIKPAGGGLLRMTGRVRSDVMLECSRCLEQFACPVDAELSIDLAPVSSLGKGPEQELGRAELDMEFYQGDEIEPLEFIKEQLLLALPMVPLHSPDCKGLCSVCGANRNAADCGCREDLRGETSVFSVLKNILKK
ncbi:MAG: DUF177 domain-containing protein [Nitrospirota bacterium]